MNKMSMVDYLAQHCQLKSNWGRRLVLKARSGEMPVIENRKALARYIQKMFEGDSMSEEQAEMISKRLFRARRGLEHYNAGKAAAE